MVMIEEDSLPLIRCAPNAPAGRMTIEELLALEQQSQLEEDLQGGINGVRDRSDTFDFV